MNQTLFVIPHEWVQGRLFWAWLIVGTIILLVSASRKGWSQAVKGFLPTFLIVAAIFYFVLPRLEVLDIDRSNPHGKFVPIGLAIRGYGVFLTMAIIAAAAVLLHRARQVGLSIDTILSLAFTMIVVGIASARLFYVFQKWDQFRIETPWHFLSAMADLTQGGLVVYGAFIGGMVSAAIFMWWTRLAARLTLDVLAPSLLLGLAIGRLGCLMNGCCYGGVCDPDFLFGLRFPAGSPPYMQQLENGLLLGVEGEYQPSERFAIQVNQVVPGSRAAELGIVPGDRLSVDLNYRTAAAIRPVQFEGLRYDGDLEIWTERGAVYRVPLAELPQWSLRVYAAQVYAAVGAFLLAALLWFYFPFRRFDGQVFAGLLLLYPINRFFEEMIRSDERGLFGTSLTISQWISFGVFLAGICCYVLFSRVGKR